MNRAIFIDKDAEFNLNEFLFQIGTGLNILQAWGYKIVVVSNQPSVAMGLIEEIDLLDLNIHLRELFGFYNLRLDGFYYCSHHPEGVVPEYSITCTCKKPLPGLYFRAAEDLNIDLSKSWMIGDILQDIEGGKRAGCKTLFVSNGDNKGYFKNFTQLPDYITYDFRETAEFIINFHSYNFISAL